MTSVEEYELEIEFERDQGPTPAVVPRPTSDDGVHADLPERAKALRSQFAGRMRAAPLGLLFVASVIGFQALSALVSLVVAAFVMPDLFVSMFVRPDGAPDPFGGALMAAMVLAPVIGTAGALIVFWRRLTGWACLVAFAAWQLVGPYVTYVFLMSQLDVPPGVVSSFWELQDAGSWTLMAIRLLFLGLLFLPGVLRWVAAPWREARQASVLAGSRSFTPAPAPAPL